MNSQGEQRIKGGGAPLFLWRLAEPPTLVYKPPKGIIGVRQIHTIKTLINSK